MAEGSHRARNAGRPARRVLFATLLAFVLGAAMIVFLPIGWAINRFLVWLYYAGRSIGMPSFVTIAVYDVALNMLLFAVPTALAALIWSRVRWDLDRGRVRHVSRRRAGAVLGLASGCQCRRRSRQHDRCGGRGGRCVGGEGTATPRPGRLTP